MKKMGSSVFKNRNVYVFLLSYLMALLYGEVVKEKREKLLSSYEVM